METFNRFGVSATQNGLMIAVPPMFGHLTFDEALLLAAWLVAMADGKRQRLSAVDQIATPALPAALEVAALTYKHRARERRRNG